MTAPMVSVYITNHNYGRFIKQSIESVLNQKFKNFELIIIDDGSTDNSREVIERYKRRHNVKIVYQQNRGLNISNNIALKLAGGKYIMRLDADDYMDENALLVMVDKIGEDAQIAMVFPDYYVVDEKGMVLAHEMRHDFKKTTLMDQPAHGACSLIRKSALLEVGGYYEDFTCQDGYELWIKFVKKFKIANTNLPLFYYRKHNRNLSRNQCRLLKTRHEIIKKGVRHLDIKEKNHIGKTSKLKI